MIANLLLYIALTFLAWPHWLEQAASPDQPAYGAPATVGPQREPCMTASHLPQVTVLTPQQDWQQILQEDARPGDTFLLRAGTYAATDKLWLKAGTAAAPITIKPYNCEAVIVQTSIRPNSHNIIAGLQIEAQGIDDRQWVVRFDGKNEGALTHIILRNNFIFGGETDAVRISGDVQQVEISGNHIDGGRDGHNIFVTAEGVANLPTAITITNNRLTKAHFTTPAEDMLQVRDVGQLTFTHNTCTNGYNMEQCVDLKRTTEPLTIAYNLFDGEQLHLAGKGEDQAGGCMVIHEEDSVADQQVVEHNFFRHCKDTLIRFATGDEDVSSSAVVRYNIFLQSPSAVSVLVLERAFDTILANNTFIYGVLKLGNSSQTRLPQNTTIKNNIFYQTAIEDNTASTAASSVTPAAMSQPPYQCRYNLLYLLHGDFVHGDCIGTIAAEPRFIDLAQADFRLQPTSPGIGMGENGTDIGAFSALRPTAALTIQAYLPLIQATP